ncbi:replicative DNA helicase [bacterium]|nr:replicative DNA helicase [bacterium]
MAKLEDVKEQKLIPQDVDAEEALLGAILINERVISKVVEYISPQSFYKIAHRDVYEAMLTLYNNNKNIDIVTVSDVLNLNNKLESVGGRAFINDLSFKAITTSNIEYYAKIVQEKSIKRALITAGAEIVSEGYNVNPSEESLDVAEKLIFDIASKKASKDIQHIKDLVLQAYENIEYRSNHKGELTGCPTGFRDLDALTNGLQRSDLIILAARPSMGKTAFALNIAQNAAIRYNVPVAIFSLEMSKQQLAIRLMSSEAEVENQKIKTGNVPSKDWTKLADAMEALANAPIYIDDTSGCTLTDIRAKCRRLAMEEKDLGLIVIDYLQLMEGSSKDDRLQQVSKISRGLKGLARELNVPIIALSQLSRAVEQRKDRIPMLSDLRESGSIEQDADVVMFIHREDYYTDREGVDESETPKKPDKQGKALIKIAKHRNGSLDDIELVFQGNIVKFKNTINTEIF